MSNQESASERPKSDASMKDAAGRAASEQTVPDAPHTKKDGEDEEMKDSDLSEEDELYYYVIPKMSADMSQEEYLAHKQKAIETEQRKDISAYSTHCVRPNNMDDAAWATEQKRQIFKLKKYATFAYCLTNVDHNDGNAMDAAVSAAENEEESYEITFMDRRPDMSDDAWSQQKQKLLAKKKSEDGEDEETKQRQNYLDQGASNAKSSHTQKALLEEKVQARLTTVPEAVRERQLQMLPILWNWWSEGAAQQDQSQLALLNQHISHVTQDAHLYRVTGTQIESFMKTITGKLRECAAESVPDDTVLGLAAQVISFTNTLRKVGLDCKMMASNDIHNSVMRCLRKSHRQDVVKRRESFENAFLEIAPAQLKVYEKTDTILEFLESGIKKANEPIVKATIEQLKGLNILMGECNGVHGYKRWDHQFPISDLEACCSDEITTSKYLTHLEFKMKILGIPGHERVANMRSVAYEIDPATKSFIRDQLLEVTRAEEPVRILDEAPLLDSGFSGLLHPESIPQSTVAWGKNRADFYINQYGPVHAPIWRIEKMATRAWTERYGQQPPTKLKVTVPGNRYGDERDSKGNPRYGQNHIQGIYGVAFWEDGDLEQQTVEELLNPDGERRLDPAYVLIGWDRKLNGRDIEKCWETRQCLRQRNGKVKADKQISNAAVQSQEKFNDWYEEYTGTDSEIAPITSQDFPPSNLHLPTLHTGIQSPVVGSGEISMLSNAMNRGPSTANHSKEIAAALSLAMAQFCNIADDDIRNKKVNKFMSNTYGKTWAELIAGE
ncbi:hypothetical protein BU24DRAFT_467140 [Aaosphaeria arxii CBS 175.79]|uniref:Uncharacterized protein n=1 Tax=Aaosphaeria arxii CBS 175.79 TaxID=1450172 RepID=A0A6A5XCI1_9PLEO|nr:uncharacterized protein BU24DRAFT_467140 [Aaosphaeria arxii CBS 175.79]KAF2010517.1 hypothetical protein BU24DRAFT_467140 [Aaosphaeria arxii CBS 175.79]